MAEKTDVEKLTEALKKERADHKAARDTLKAAQEKIAELEQQNALGTNPNAAQVSEFITNSVKAGVASETAELHKKIGTLTSQLEEAHTARVSVEGKLASRTVSDAIRAAAADAHVKREAMADALTLGSLELRVMDNGEVQTPDGLSVDQWLDQRRNRSPHWWPVARGAGARGSGDGASIYSGSNPWTAESFNLTEQGRMVRTNPEQAKLLQAQAGAMARQ